MAMVFYENKNNKSRLISNDLFFNPFPEVKFNYPLANELSFLSNSALHSIASSSYELIKDLLSFKIYLIYTLNTMTIRG